MLSFVLGYFKENKKLFLCFVIFISIVMLLQNWSLVFETILPRILRDLLYLFVFSSFCGFVMYTLKLSDSKSNRRVTEYMEKQEFHKTIYFHSIMEINFKQYFFDSIGYTRLITIKNMTGDIITRCAGFIYFVNTRNERYLTIPFDFRNLSQGQSIKLDRELYETNNFSSCSIFELDIQVIEGIERNFRIEKFYSEFSVPTYFMALNNKSFSDHYLFRKLKVPYNLVWLKEKLSYILPCVRLFLRRDALYKILNFKRDLIPSLKRLVRIGLVILLSLAVFALCALLLFSTAKCIILILDLANILAVNLK